MATVKETLTKLNLETDNTEDLETEVIKVEETTDGARLYIQPGYYVMATHAN